MAEDKNIQRFFVGKQEKITGKKDAYNSATSPAARFDSYTPKERLNTSKGWIDFGKKNDYPQEILRLVQTSDAVHTNILYKNRDMIASQGWIETPALAEFLKNSAEGCSLDEVAVDVAWNCMLFGGYYLNLVWDEEGEFIAKIKSVPYEKVRVAVPEDAMCDKPEKFWISRNWMEKSKKENEPFPILAFDASDESVEGIQRRKDFPSQLMFVRINPCGLDWYTLPAWNAGMIPVKLSFEMWNYQLRSAQRGYRPELICSIPNVPNEEQQMQITQDLQSRGGSDEAGDTVVLFGEDAASLPTFEVVQPSNADKKYLELIDKTNTQIYIANNTNNVVANVAIEGKLSNASEVLEQYQMHQLFVIAPYQKKIQDTFNKICVINGLPEEMKLKNYINYIQQGLAPATPAETPAQS